jgi:aryl carrier-like protein
MAQKKDQFRLLVHSVLAQSSRRHSVAEIRPEQKLEDLGLDSVEIANVKTKLFRIVAGRDEKKLPTFLKALRISKATTVGELTNSFVRSPLVSGIRLPAAASLPGYDTTESKGLIETAVRALLSQASACSYQKLTPETKLADLGIDRVGIVDLKTGILRTFSGSGPSLDFDKFSRSLNVTPRSTVKQVIHSSVNALDRPKKQRPAVSGEEADLSDLAGDDTTEAKGAESDEP